MPRATIATFTRRRAAILRTRAMSATVPPSPSLSARMISATELSETTSVIVQRTSEITPCTSASVGSTAPRARNTAGSAYRAGADVAEDDAELGQRRRRDAHVTRARGRALVVRPDGARGCR